jgi:HlyD family secretion protein
MQKEQTASSLEKYSREVTMKRKMILIGGIAIILVTAAFYWFRQSQSASAAASTAKTQTVTVQRGSLAATVSAAGNVSTPTTAALAFSTSAKVTQVNVQVGDQIIKGAVLMLVETADLNSALKTAQLGLATAQASYDSAKIDYAQNPNQLIIAKAALNQAQAALQKAQADYDPIAWRPDVGMTTQSLALQQATDTYRSALATYNITAASINDSALKAAQVKVDEAQVAVDDAQRNLDNAKLVAPFDGVVSAVNYGVGDTASGTAVTLVDPSVLQVKVTISEVDIAKVQVGETASMTLDALTGNTYTATVMSVSPVGTVSSGVVNYTATLEIKNADGAIKPGMTANLALEVERRDNVLLVPVRAVRTSGTRKVVTVQANGQSIQTTVTTGLSNDTSIEIVSGVKEGDVVVVSQTTTSTNSANAAASGGNILGSISGGPSGPPPN